MRTGSEMEAAASGGSPAPGGEYGVWDYVTERWHTEPVHLREEAESIAFGLNLTYDRSGARPDGHARRVDPPRRVEVRVIAQRWRDDGTLDWWVKESDGWYGHVTFDGSATASWWPADRLRPTDELSSAPTEGRSSTW